MAPAVPIVYTGQKAAKNLGKMVGKSRKLSNGYSGGLVSDYRHAAEITAESEGFGSSGRVDTEVTLSEDSCSPKRKCISLNGDSRDRFGVPVQVLSVSKMSGLEKKDMGVRLKRELEEIRILQRRIVAWSSSVVSPTSDIRSCSDGLKRPPLENNNNNTQRIPGHASVGKKRIPPGKDVALTKKGFPRQIDPPKQAAPMNTVNVLLMKQCETLLKRLMKSQHAWVFNTPVDVVKLNIPDYFKVIKHPMDLGTIKSKLARGEYSGPLDFAADVRLTFSNAMTYNPPGNDVHFMAKAVSSFFEQRWKPIEKKIPANTDMQVLPSRMDVQTHNEVAIDVPPPPKKKKVPPVTYNKVEPVKKGMTNEEKHKLSMELEASLCELPENIIDFLKENSSGAGQTNDDEIEIDIDALSDDVLFKLRKLLDGFLLEKKQQSKVEPCEMELHNESGFSTSSIQPGKGNDAVDEDVDIGGNDHPVSSFPPVEVEKDTAITSSRCSSPSSSSSDSGSSSSDSDTDSDNFPCGESEGKKVQHEINKFQGTTLDIKPKLEQNQGDVQDDGRNQPQKNLCPVEDNSLNKPPPVGVDDHKDGESAPSERQVSPDKMYRAALLRSRFADTILKAQEKTLEKGEKRDPEKLRLEREELERRQKEEKARLDAEVKAAEAARKKAEAVAAAEAKRKRELEREAARLALQKMEKTVDINENCQFLEDLEMLRAAPADNLSSFIDDASPDDSPSGRLGSFRLGRNSNPLEQLGLYMKDDDEEEEEVEVEARHGAPNPPSNDVEEGEID